MVSNRAGPHSTLARVPGMQRSGGNARPTVSHGPGLELSEIPAAEMPSVAAAAMTLDSCKGPACALAVSSTIVMIAASIETVRCQEIASR